MLSLIAIIMVDSEGGTGLREFLKCRFVIIALRKFSKSHPRTFGTTFVVTKNVHYCKRKEEQHPVPPSFCSTVVIVVDDGHDR